MAAREVPNHGLAPENLWATRTYAYYNRYPEPKVSANRAWRKKLHRLGVYLRLMFLALVALLIGGVCPVILSYELVFKPLLFINCNECLIVAPEPYFQFNYVMASALGVFGFMMPIFVLYILFRIIRSPSIRRDLLH